MSNKIDSMLHPVGITEDGKYIIAGVFRFFETTGLPLDIIIECLAKTNAIVSWYDFYTEARRSGMEHKRITSKISEAMFDVHGREMRDDALREIAGEI